MDEELTSYVMKAPWLKDMLHAILQDHMKAEKLRKEEYIDEVAGTSYDDED